jgi:hypothetical protein
LLLRQAAKAIGVGADFIDVKIGLVVQRSQQLAHAREHSSEIGGFLVLGVGAFGNVDIEPVAGEFLISQRSAAGEPIGRVDRLHDNSSDPGILVQDFGGELGDGGGDFGLQRRCLARA